MRRGAAPLPDYIDDRYQYANRPPVDGDPFPPPHTANSVAFPQSIPISTHRPDQILGYQPSRTDMAQNPRKRQQTSTDYTDSYDSSHKRQASAKPVEFISLIDDDDLPQRRHQNSGLSSAYHANVLPAYPPHHHSYQAPGSQDAPYEISSSASPEPTSDTKHRKPDLSKYTHTAPAPTIANGSIDDIVPITEPILCQEQAELVDLIVSGRNVFYTGSAGCGKSTVLKAFVKRFREVGKHVDIIAPTGRAALDINGTTTWSYAGWTPDHHKRPLKDLKAAAHGKFVRRRLMDTDVLVIDEISMVENLHFERLNVVMKEARNDPRPFGGVQLIVTGDFCQLPPVKPFRHCIECGRELVPNRAGTEYTCRDVCTEYTTQGGGIYFDIHKWAFQSKAWEECKFEHVNLTNIHRQSDAVFISILQKLRIGHPLPSADIHLLLNHKSETRNAIRLFATREEVKRVNDDMFSKLRSKARSYRSLDNFKWVEQHRNLESKNLRGPDGSLNALRDHRFDPHIQLKKGMLVVLLHNLDIPAGLVNGSQGTIQGFENYDPKKMPRTAQKLRKTEAEVTAAVTGVPVLAGDHALYREWQIDEYVKQAEQKAWPIVRFLNGVERTIYADCTVNELGDKAPHSLLSRTQIPLMAAWAMTTHKSQGMTLNRVVVDLAKTFEQGQAYVALSRARSLDGLKVESFPQSAQSSGNAQVKEFLRDKFGIQ